MTINSEKKHLFPHPRPIYPWVIWVLCNLFNFYIFLIQFSAWDLRSYLASNPFLSEHILDPFIIAIILFQIPVALLIDQFGPRKVTSIFILISAIGVLLFSYKTSPGLMIFGNFLMGLGGTVTYVNTFKLVSNWFLPEKFPIMVGWTILASFIGALVGQPLTLHLVKTFSWSSIMVNYGILGIVFSIVFFLSVRDQGYQIIPKPKLFRLGAATKKVFKSKQSYLLGLAFGLALAPWLAFTGKWNIFYYEQYGFSPSQRLIINLFDFACFPIGAIFFGFLAKKTATRKPWVVLGLIGSLILVTLFIYLPPLSFWGIALLTMFTAFFLSSMVLCYTVIRESHIHAIAATAFSVITVSLALLRIIENHLFHGILGQINQKPTLYSLIDFKNSLSIIPISIILSLICILFVKETNSSNSIEG